MTDPEIRVCKVCGKTKPIEEFPQKTSGGYTYRFRMCSICHKAKERERQRKYMEKNRQAHNRRARLDRAIRYEKDPEFAEKQRARSREYYRRNREKILARRAERKAQEG